MPGGLKVSRTEIAPGLAKLKVLIRIEVDMSAAYIQVRGSVTDRNLGAVLGLARRANSIVAGMAVVIDLRQASIGSGPLETLQRACIHGQLPPAVDPLNRPCLLQVLEPMAA